MSDILNRVRHLLVEHLGVEPDQVVPEALLVPAHDRQGRVLTSSQSDLGCDSLDVIEIAMAAEEEFGIVITDTETETLNTGTVGNLVAIIESRLQAKR
jgi:acyl carrier protein